MLKPEYIFKKDPAYISLAKEVQEYLHRAGKLHSEKIYFRIKILFATALLISGYALLFGNFFSIISGYILLTFFSFFSAFSLAHDFAHLTVFKEQKNNVNAFYIIMSLLGVSGYFWRERHLESHHPHPNIDDYDLDIETSGWLRFSRGQVIRKCHQFQYIYAPFLYMFYSLNWILRKDFVSLYAYSRPDKGIRIFKLIGVKLIYFNLFLILPWTYSEFSGLFLVVFLLHHFLLSLFIVFTFLISHYTTPVLGTTQEMIDESWFRHQIGVSVDFHSDKQWANWVFGGFNCHVAHHLFPMVNSYHYPHITLIIKKWLNNERIAHHELSFVEGIKSHIGYLKQLGK